VAEWIQASSVNNDRGRSRSARLIARVENLRQSAPADIADKDTPFRVRCASFLLLNLFEKLDGFEVVTALLLK
jgi:hypothetical protein